MVGESLVRALWLLLVFVSPAALAQAVPQQPAIPAPDTGAEPELEADEIVVTGGRLPGAVIGDIQPEVILDGRAIRAYGAATIDELLQELAPLTGSIQGRGEGGPVVLLGGRRISGFREIRDLPPEAIARVDILPEEVALKYGYRPDQKVVNIVLRRRFNAVTTELEGAGATEGGQGRYQADLNYLRLQGGTRLSLDGEYAHVDPLFETERDVASADPNRTLVDASDRGKLNATYNRNILGNVSATLSGEFEAQESRSGLGSAGTTPLLRDRSSRDASINYALNGDIDRWRWTLTGGYESNSARTLTDRAATLGVRDRATSLAETLGSEAVLTGDVAQLPAGAVAVTLKGGVSLRDIASTSSRAAAPTELSRDLVSGQGNIDLPITREGAIGALSLNANGEVQQLSDFGALGSVGYGFNWRPSKAVRLIGSVTHEQGAPSIQQLGDPVIVTPEVRVFDLTTGQTVEVAVTEGGNAALRADSRRVFKLGLTLQPIPKTDLTLLANFTDSRVDNPIAGFPTATPEIEAAFPSRFRRVAGTLVSIDSRPVNFSRSEQRQFRWGINWSETLEAPPRPTGEARARPPGEELLRGRPGEGGPVGERPQGEGPRSEGPGGERRPGAGPGGRGPGGFGGRGFGFGPGGGRQGRVQLSLFHTWRLEDTILIRPGVPELDLLDGSATGGRGGQPRHEIEFNAGYNRNGIGVRASGNWQSGTTVIADPSGAPSAGDLTFGSFFTANLRAFADLGAVAGLGRAHPFFRGARATLAIDNVFNQRLEVRDATGAVPIRYQPALLDPVGRSIRIELRKLFF
jgi:outer membrane cobalamin receptor